jgi:hypothetical protein
MIGGANRRVRVVIPFDDAREISDRCGMVKSVFGGESGPVRCGSDPTVWIGELLAQELRSAGFEVLGDDDALSKDAVRIDGAMVKLFVEPVIGGDFNWIETDIHVHLVVTSKSGLRAERDLFSKETIKPADPRRAAFYQESFEKTASRLARDMVKAIRELMDQYPQLG